MAADMERSRTFFQRASARVPHSPALAQCHSQNRCMSSFAAHDSRHSKSFFSTLSVAAARRALRPWLSIRVRRLDWRAEGSLRARSLVSESLDTAGADEESVAAVS